MDIWAALKAVILGIVEGVTEFLPISSTGHLIIAERFLRLTENAGFNTSFAVVIQLGAILAIVVLFWNNLWPFAGSSQRRRQSWATWARVVVGVLPALILGLLLEQQIALRLFNPLVVGITLLFYGAVLVLVELLLRRARAASVAEVHRIPLFTAFGVGLFQCLALVPGTSRAAATIIGGMLLGLSRSAAAQFSFFLAVPIMVGASLLTIVKHGRAFTAGQWGLLACGFGAAFLMALLVVRAFMRYLQKRDFIPFGYYRMALGVVVLVLLAVVFHQGA